MPFFLARRLWQTFSGSFHLGNFTRCVLIGSGIAFALQREQERGLLQPLDAPLRKLLLDQRMDLPTPSGPVHFIACQEADLPEPDRQFSSWPLNAADWGGVLAELASFQPKTAMVTSRLPVVGASDILKPALDGLKTGFLASPAEGFAPENATWKLPASYPLVTRIRGYTTWLPEIRMMPALSDYRALGRPAAFELELGEGSAGKVQMKDGNLRVPMLFRCQENVVPSLFLQSLAEYLEVPIGDVEAIPGRWLLLGQVRLPLDDTGYTWLPWNESNAQQVPKIPLDTFKLNAAQLEKYLTDSNPVKAQLKELPKAFAVVGYDELGSRRLTLPNGEKISSSDATARLAKALLGGRFLLPVTPWVKWAYLGCCLMLGWLLYLMRPGLAVLASVSALAGVLAFPYIVFLQDLAYLSPVPGVLLVALLPWVLRVVNYGLRAKKPAAVVAAAASLFFLSSPPPVEAHHQPGVTIEMLTEQLQKTPGLWELHFQRGSEYLYQRRYEESSADFREVLKLNPEHLPSSRLLAQILSEQGKPEEALGEISRGIQRTLDQRSGEPAVKNWLSQAYCQQAALQLVEPKNAALALETLDKALAGSPYPELDIYRLRGEALRILGKQEQRIAELKAAYDKTGVVIIRNEWLEALIESGRHAEALPFIETNLANARMKAGWQLRRARVFLAIDKKTEAKADLQAAIEALTPIVTGELPPYTYLLDRGLAYALLEDYTKAKADLAKAKDLGARPGEWRLLERHLKP
jgi:tetratricopeptide (TPR) repeat protein